MRVALSSKMSCKKPLVIMALCLLGTSANNHSRVVERAKGKLSSWLSNHEPMWWKGLKDKAKDSMESGADEVHVSEIIREGGSVEAKSCGKKGDIMRVYDVRYDPALFSISTHGVLEQEVSGGTIEAKIRLSDAPVNATGLQRLKRAFVFIASGKHSATEPLCHQLFRGDAGASNIAAHAREEKCPLAKGEHTFHFNFETLPAAIAAGRYNVQLRAVDATGHPVACVEGHLHVPHGRTGELHRRLQMQEASLVV